MRIGQLAEIVGTTTRTVRHYHRLGLLAEPRRLANGYREYAIGDVVRLMRIRWLVNSGVPLGSVATILSEQNSGEDELDVVTDLRALIRGVEREQTELARRHARLTAMLAEAERGQRISALPGELATAFDRAADSAPSGAVGAALRLERDLLEAVVLTGAAPQGFVTGFGEMLADDGQHRRYLELLSEWADLEGRSPDSVAAQIDALVDGILGFFARWPAGFDLRGAGDGAETGAISLDDIVADRAQREVVRRIRHELATGVELSGDTP